MFLSFIGFLFIALSLLFGWWALRNRSRLCWLVAVACAAFGAGLLVPHFVCASKTW
jgi:hypothetical protein